MEISTENRVKVRIIGREYTLVTENSPEYTVALAEKLDAQMNSMLAVRNNLSGIDVAILSALDAMDEAQKASDNEDSMRYQLGEYVATANRSKQSYDTAKREIAQLKKRIEELEKKLNESSLF